MNTNEVITKLAELITTITDVAVVYKGIPETREEFPAVSIMPLGWNDELYSYRDNKKVERFQIDVFTLLDGQNSLTKQQVLIDVVNQVRDLLSKQENIKLGGLIAYSSLTQGDYSFDEKETKLYICSIVYSANDLFNRQVA